MLGLNKYSIITIIVTICIIIYSSFVYLLNQEARKEQELINKEKADYQSSFNPYYLNELSEKGEIDINDPSLDFYKNKSLYIKAQKELDEGLLEDALISLNNIRLSSFTAITMELKGDVYLKMKEYDKAYESYLISLNSIDKKNEILREIVFAKMQKATQLK